MWKSKQQIKLHSSFNKYSIEAHEFKIIHELPCDISQIILDSYEQFYMDSYKECNIQLMNLREAGSHGRHSEESKNKLSIAHTGKILSDETKKRISNSRKGLGTGSSNGMYGIGLTGEAKERMRQSKIGSKQSIETINKRAKKLMKCVLQFSLNGEFLKEWESIGSIKLSVNISRSAITRSCNNPKFSSYGYRWKFK